MLNRNQNLYPLQYAKNPNAYFLFETPTNLTISEIEEHINNTEKLDKYLLSSSNSDFYNYIQASFGKLSKSSKEVLNKNTLTKFKSKEISDVMRYIVSEMDKEILARKVAQYMGNGSIGYSVPDELVDMTDKEANQVRFERWKLVLEDANYDISEQIKFFTSFQIFSFQLLHRHYGEIYKLIKTIDIKKYNAPEFLLLEYLSELGQCYAFSDWDKNIWDNIKQLSFQSLLNFLMFQNIVQTTHNEHEYFLLKTVADFDHPNTPRDNSYVINKLKEQISNLKKSGYVLILKDTNNL